MRKHSKNNTKLNEVRYIRIASLRARTPQPRFEIDADADYRGTVETADDGRTTLRAGDLALAIGEGEEWLAEFT